MSERVGLGGAIQILPRSVTVGFSTGIAVLVVTKQLPDPVGTSSQVPADGTGSGPRMVLAHVTQVDPRAIILGLA